MGRSAESPTAEAGAATISRLRREARLRTGASIMAILPRASRSSLTIQATSQVHAVDRAGEAHGGLLAEMPTATWSIGLASRDGQKGL